MPEPDPAKQGVECSENEDEKYTYESTKYWIFKTDELFNINYKSSQIF